jgi:uncharacterized membrane protein YfcA
MGNLAPFELALFLIAAFTGALVSGIAGFAFGLFASAIWLHVVTPAQSAALIAAFAIVIQGLSLWKLRHALKLFRLWPYLIGAALGIPLGAAVLSWTSPPHMRAFIGAALVLFSIYSLVRPKLPNVEGGKFADGVIGAISGFVGGSTGLAGIPVVVWSTLRGWSKDEQRAVFQPVAITIFAMVLLWFTGSGMVTAATVWLFVLGLPAVLLGMCLGLELYGKLNEATFRMVVMILLLISGLTLLPSAFMTAN